MFSRDSRLWVGPTLDVPRGILPSEMGVCEGRPGRVMGYVTRYGSKHVSQLTHFSMAFTTEAAEAKLEVASEWFLDDPAIIPS